MASGRLRLHCSGEPLCQHSRRRYRPEHLRHRRRRRDRGPPCVAGAGGAGGGVGASGCVACEPPFFLYLEERGADVLIAVKNSRHKGFQVIKEHLTHCSTVSHQTSKRERGHGRDITWTLRAMPAPAWVVENWPGSAMIIAVRSKGKRGRKLIDETRTYVTSLRTGPMTPGSTRMGTATASATA